MNSKFSLSRSYLLAAALFIAVFCSVLFITSCNSNPFTDSTPPKDVPWIVVQTGFADSTFFYTTDKDSLNAFILTQYEKHFSVAWKRVDNAACYEVRTSQQPINTQNWNNALLCGIVSQSDNDTIKTNILAKPKILQNLCTGCQVCIGKCPQKAIRLVRNKAVINPSLCTGCGVCFESCTFDAIEDRTFGKFYYFAVKAVSASQVLSQGAATTSDAFKIRHTNWFEKCGICGKTCFIYDRDGIPLCPVDAIKYYNEGKDKDLVYIDFSKCINCGNCLRKCFLKGWESIRREIVSSTTSPTAQ